MMFCSKSLTNKTGILIVKDKPEELKQFSLVLSDLGYSVQITNNTAMLFMLARATAPSLILLDINLSEIDNIEVYRLLKAEQQTNRIPVVFFNDLDNLCERLKSLNNIRTNSTIDISKRWRQVVSV